MFKPDYRNLEDCARNKKPARIPLYEHNVDPRVAERITKQPFVHCAEGEKPDYETFFRHFAGFFRDYGYDAVSYECCITEILPDGGALNNLRQGVIQTAEDFEKYPFDQVPDLFIRAFQPKLDALRKVMPDGMKAVGGVGNGVFEIAEDLVGYENLCLLGYDDPDLYAALFKRIGRMMKDIWTWFLEEYADVYCVCRFGDDLGYRSNTLISADDIRTHILPAYKGVVDVVHAKGKPFLLHSCGCIFSVMDDLIEKVGIDAKHSNEDQIAPMEEWVRRYGDRIGNFGGLDTDHLVRMPLPELKKKVEELWALANRKNGGFAIGSGNSIPAYVDDEHYLLMLRTIRDLRGD